MREEVAYRGSGLQARAGAKSASGFARPDCELLSPRWTPALTRGLAHSRCSGDAQRTKHG